MKHFSNKHELKQSLAQHNLQDIGLDINSEDISFSLLETDNNLLIGITCLDSNSFDFFENDEGAGSFFEFTSQEQVDSKQEELKGKLFYLVDRYSHGNVHYSVSNTKSYPDDRWDVAHGCAIYVPCDYIQSEYKKFKKELGIEKATEKYIEDSNNVLNSYSDWRNGEVYGYRIIAVNKSTGKILYEDSCYGYIGQDVVNKEKELLMNHIKKDESLNKMYNDIEFKNITIKDYKDIGFKIPKKGFLRGKLVKINDEIILGSIYEDKFVVYRYQNGMEKPKKAQLEEWQKKYGVTGEEFMEARMKSDIKEILEKSLDEKLKTPKMKL